MGRHPELGRQLTAQHQLQVSAPPPAAAPAPQVSWALTMWPRRSFEPILRLLPQSISPVSQHWATWALYNLVSVYRESCRAPRQLSKHLQLLLLAPPHLSSAPPPVCSQKVLSPADQGRRTQASGEGPGAGELPARDQGHGQVRSPPAGQDCRLLIYSLAAFLSSSKVMEHCENFKDDPMETNDGQEVNYGHRG